MKVLIVLIATFFMGSVIAKIATDNWHFISNGNVAMCVMLCFASMGHFRFTNGMTLMMPEFIPFKKKVVYFTGMAEIALGVGLLFPSLRYIFGIIVVIFFILILPANINAAIKHVNLEAASYEGKGTSYLWFRIPMQVFFIIWVIYFSLSK